MYSIILCMHLEFILSLTSTCGYIEVSRASPSHQATITQTLNLAQSMRILTPGVNSKAAFPNTLATTEGSGTINLPGDDSTHHTPLHRFLGEGIE